MLPEFFNTCSFYGHSTILKKYAGVRTSVPMPFAIQHGIYSGNPTRVDLEGGANLVWLWSERIHERFRERFSDATFLGGAPFLYLLNMFESCGISFKPKMGTVVFPAHSSHLVAASQDDDEYAEEIAALPSHFHPIVVCMYYVDLKYGRDLPYAMRNLRVVSIAEDRRDPLFLYKFLKLFGRRKFAFAGSNTSALFYMCALGADVFLENKEVKLTNKGNPWFDECSFSEAATFAEKSARIFSPNVSREEKWKFASDELGARYIRTKVEVRDLIVQHRKKLLYYQNAFQFCKKAVKIRFKAAVKRRFYCYWKKIW